MLEPYYETELGKLYHGDCLEILPQLTEKVDLVLTDPPYGIGFPYISYDDTRPNLENLIKGFLPISLDIAFNVYVLCGPTQINLYPQADWVCVIEWTTTGSFGKYGYNQWTPLLCYGKDIKGLGSVNGVLKSDVLRIKGGGGVAFHRSDLEKEHSCPKPISIMKLVLNRISYPDNLILDPFLGSGTTAVACERLGRRWIGIEISKEYCDISIKRIEQEKNQLKMF